VTEDINGSRGVVPRLNDEAVARIEKECGATWNEDVWESLVRYLTQTKGGRGILVQLIAIWHPLPSR
jgi:hypothetical protein